MRFRITRAGIADSVIGLFSQGHGPVGFEYKGFEPPPIEESDHRYDVGVVETEEAIDLESAGSEAPAVMPKASA